MNVPAIAAMTVAAQDCYKDLSSSLQQAKKLRNLFLSLLEKEKNRVTIYGSTGDEQIPHTIGLRLHGLEGQWVMLECKSTWVCDFNRKCLCYRSESSF